MGAGLKKRSRAGICLLKGTARRRLPPTISINPYQHYSEMQQVMKVFADCFPVKGHSRSAVYDLGRNNFYLIPNSLYDLLITCEGLTHDEIYGRYDADEKAVLDEYFQFLNDHELIFFIDKSLYSSFPPLTLQWDFPAVITNCIIDIKEHSSADFGDLFMQLEQLGCHVIQLRIFCEKDLEFLTQLLSLLDRRDIKSVEIVLKYSEKIAIDKVNLLKDTYSRIAGISVYNAPEECMDATGFVRYQYTDELINERSCGKITEFMNPPNITFFNESQQYNTCLNRKISVDADGNIKNCPSMTTSYGHIKDTRLAAVANNAGFQKYWQVHKGQISVCKDCEFRHVCTDCRAYLEEPDNHYSKPLKCGYNPYTGEWEEWKNNPFKQKAIEYYKMH
jgi:SPASM domain peptide maturase of grasp-with-spasm system